VKKIKQRKQSLISTKYVLIAKAKLQLAIILGPVQIAIKNFEDTVQFFIMVVWN
jgi:hypothetical protein